MSRMEYSVLKEKMKDNECGWSYTRNNSIYDFSTNPLAKPLRFLFLGGAAAHGGGERIGQASGDIGERARRWLWACWY
jgi:hypothetical protein